MKAKQIYSAPLCDFAALDAVSMLAASYGDEGTPGSYAPDFDFVFPKPF